MQPDEAAKWLLELSTANESGSTSLATSARIDTREQQPTTIAELLAQLGPPPAAIQQDWDHQLAMLAAAYEQTTGRALTELSSHDILVDPNNRLSFSSEVLAGLAASGRPHQDVPATKASVNEPQYDDRAIPSSRAVAVFETDRDIPRNSERTSQQSNRSTEKKSTTHPRRAVKKPLFSKHRWLGPGSVIAAAAVALGLTFFILMPASKPDSKSISTSKPTAASSSSIFSPTTSNHAKPSSPAKNNSSAKVAAKKNGSSMDELQVGEFQLADDSAAMTSTSESESTLKPSTDAANEKPAPSKAMLGLDSFAGGNWVSATDLLPTADFDTSTTADDSTDPVVSKNESASAVLISNESADAVAGTSAVQSDDADVSAPDSPTSNAAGVTSIELPALPARAIADDEIEFVSIAVGAVDKVEMLFPVETPLSLVSDNGSWVIQDNKDQAPIARIFARDDDLQFRWTSLAATRPIAKQIASALLNLSLRDGTSRPLFLRPVVTAEAWPIDLAIGDARAAWPITTSAPSDVSRLNVEFQLPETVIQTWVQPHDPAQVRRSQSIVEFTLGSDSKIAIRSRLELKTGTRITLRMRHAAQLDPSFPWQIVSTPRIQDALEQVTMQSAQALAEQEQIKVIYYKANSAEKRVLGPQRDAIATVVLRLRDLSERLTKFDRLLSQLDHAAHMRIRLDVAWPDTAPLVSTDRQVIFAMDAPTSENP